MKLEFHKRLVCNVSLRRLFAETLSEIFRNVAHHINVKPLNHNWLRVIPSFRGDVLLGHLESKMFTV
jgi:hypothetical protein